MAALLTLFGFLLRLGVLRTQGSFWFDEAFSVRFASLPLSEAYPLLLHDVHPPGYYLLLHVWMSVFGATEPAARMLSVVLGSAAVYAVFVLTKDAFGKAAATAAGLVVAISPAFLFHSAEARMYPLVVVLSALAAREAVLSARDAARGIRRWVVWSALAMSVHLFAVLPFLAAACMLGAPLRRDRVRLRAFIVRCAAGLAPLVVWLAFALPTRFGSLGREWQISGGASGNGAARFTDLFLYGAEPWVGELFSAAVALAVAAALFRATRETGLAWRVEAERGRERWLLAAMAAAPFVLALPIRAGTVKYFFVALPAAAALVGAGIARLLRLEETPLRRNAPGLAALALYAAIAAAPVAGLLTGTRIRFDDLAATIAAEARPGDVVYLDWFAYRPQAERYLGAETPVLDSNPYAGMPLDHALMFHAGQLMTKAQVEAVLAGLEDRLGPYRRVFLITSDFDFGKRPVEAWFFERGWRLAGMRSFGTYTPRVAVFERR